ncbi:MAG: tetratricopeptide repeat protein, partial [Pseudomonadota bacterium]
MDEINMILNVWRKSVLTTPALGEVCRSLKSVSFVLCLLLFSTTYGQDAPHKQHAKEARQYELAGEHKKALASYQKALELSRSVNEKQAAAIAYFKGSLHLSLQQYAEAETDLKESVALREKAFNPNHPAVAVSLIGLAGVYYALGDYEQSKPLYERAVKINETAFTNPDDQYRITVSLNSLAEQHRTLAEFDKAEPLFKRALKIDQDKFGENSTKVSIRLNNLAELYRQSGDYAQAKELLEKALKIEQDALAKQETAPENVGIRLNNTGRLYQTLGAYPKADEYYEQALDIWAKTPGKSDIKYAIGLNNQAWIAYATGNYSKALKLYQEASGIVEKIHGDSHPELARHLNNLGLLYFARQKYDDAEKAWLRGLKILETVYDPQHPEIGTILHNLAKLYRAQQNYPKAEETLQRALMIAQASDQPELLWAVQDNFSQLLLAQQNSTAAVIYGKQAVNTLQGLRADIASMDKQLQKAFLEDKSDVY